MPSWMAGVECGGIVVGNQNPLSDALAQIASRGFQTAVFKPDLSASGRGMYRIQADSNIAKEFQDDVAAVVEPYFDRVVDLSFLWHMPQNQSGDANFLGWTRPEVSKGGRYEGTVLNGPFFDCEPEVRKFLLADKCQKLKTTAQWLEENLIPELKACQFSGDFGVDAFVFRDADSNLRIRPFVELNPRTTMGHVALALEKRIADGARARLRILTQSQYRSERKRFESSKIELTRQGRLKSGVVFLGERSETAKLIPCLAIE